MCKSLTNYFPRNNDFLVTCFGKTQMNKVVELSSVPPEFFDRLSICCHVVMTHSSPSCRLIGL